MLLSSKVYKGQAKAHVSRNFHDAKTTATNTFKAKRLWETFKALHVKPRWDGKLIA